jgi:flagellar export protein FliJ
MKPFKFSLQSLRTLREQKERAAQQHYTEALRACEEAAKNVKLAGNELAGCWTTLCDKLSQGVDSTELLRTRAWCNVLELRLREKTGLLEQARHNMDNVWSEMMRATRDREALDKFHDKRRAVYDREEQREEQKRLDELALRTTNALPAAMCIPPPPAKMARLGRP